MLKLCNANLDDIEKELSKLMEHNKKIQIFYIFNTTNSQEPNFLFAVQTGQLLICCSDKKSFFIRNLWFGLIPPLHNFSISIVFPLQYFSLILFVFVQWSMLGLIKTFC